MIMFHLSPESSNAKTGPMPVTSTGWETCPPRCPFRDNGCYTENYGLNFLASGLDAGTKGMPVSDFLNSLANLPRKPTKKNPRNLMRAGQVGDVPSKHGKIDRGFVASFILATKGLRPFGYTHHELNSHNIGVIRMANARGYTINASCETDAQVSFALAQGIPAVQAVPSSWGRTKNKAGEYTETIEAYHSRLRAAGILRSAEGFRRQMCPATWMDTDCAHCGICAEADRKTVVCFPGHGTKAKAIDQALKEAA